MVSRLSFPDGRSHQYHVNPYSFSPVQQNKPVKQVLSMGEDTFTLSNKKNNNDPSFKFLGLDFLSVGLGVLVGGALWAVGFPFYAVAVGL